MGRIGWQGKVMPTQDDTFRILSRCSYDEAWNVVSEEARHGSRTDVNERYDANITSVLAKIGWTELELKKRYRDFLLNTGSGVEDYSWWQEFVDLIQELENERG